MYAQCAKCAGGSATGDGLIIAVCALLLSISMYVYAVRSDAARSQGVGALLKGLFFEHTDFSERLPKDQHGTLTDRVACTSMHT